MTRLWIHILWFQHRISWVKVVVWLWRKGISSIVLAMSNTMLSLIANWTLWFRTNQRTEEVRRSAYGLWWKCLTEMESVLVSIDLIGLHVLLMPRISLTGKVSMAPFWRYYILKTLTLHHVIQVGVVEVLSSVFLIIHAIMFEGGIVKVITSWLKVIALVDLARRLAPACLFGSLDLHLCLMSK